MAPSSFLFTVARQSTSSAGLPHPSGSALVWRRPSCTTGLHPSVFSSSLPSSGSVRLLHPLGSSSVLCCSSSTVASRNPHLRVGCRHHLFRLGPPDPPRRPCSLALRLCLKLLLHLLRHCWSAPWSRQPFLLHGSSLRRLHHGPP